MIHWKMIFIKLAALAAALTMGFSHAADLCECGFVAGVDYLYWSSCLSNMHFAAEGTSLLTDPHNTVKYHFIHDDWDSGYRVYAGKEDFLGCFDLLFSYASFDARHTQEALAKDPEELSLSWPMPFEIPYGQYATVDWKIDFERYKLTAGYAIEFGKGSCLCLIPYAGVDYASICQDRTDTMYDKKEYKDAGDSNKDVNPTVISTIKRSLDYDGVGPLVGMGYRFEFCNGLSTFGNASVSVLVGEVDIKDRLTLDDDGIITSNHEKYHDDCVCVPGVHLQMGLSYEGCVSNMKILFRAGYEYLQWMHAPSYILYNQNVHGTISGLNHNSITFQGFFGGVSLLF